MQIVGIASTLRRMQSAEMEPARSRVRRTMLPLIPDLALVGMLAYLQSSGTIRFLKLFMPDLASTAWASGTLAWVSAVLRVSLLFRALQKPGGPRR
jgi:hypothetical protein